MKTLKGSLFLFIAIFTSSSFANNWYDRGNAGFALFCDSKAPELLDVHEISARHFRTADFPKVHGTLEKVIELISRLDEIDPARSALYKEWAREFFFSVQFASSMEFAPTPDLGLVKVPFGCSLQQVAFQRTPSILNSVRYIINLNHWTQLDENNQAALVLHEIIYREFVTTNTAETSSERIRYFNSMLIANAFKGMTLPQYLEILRELHFSHYRYASLELLIGYIDDRGEWNSTYMNFADDGSIETATLSRLQKIDRHYLQYSCGVKKDGELAIVKLSPNGLLRSLQVVPSFNSNDGCPLPHAEYIQGDDSFKIYGDTMIFNEEGVPTEISSSRKLGYFESFSYKGNVFNFRMSQGPATSYYRFDDGFNLVELGLGGAPCLNPRTHHVDFLPANSYNEANVYLKADGSFETQPPLCY
ncbi:hypothetical protein QJS83_02160 [Bdellovibrio sp. 22V]|uniref:hypothetical protein n=1 Tax=Bdellovibrio TaxID=958 RepID=UPI002543A1BA|nr:hypothetical protein [Bdellovibrio sp. 22V]WII72672.1 hypothetical protein QJS83_02160 [Bdellovibrio sp. 22V]